MLRGHVEGAGGSVAREASLSWGSKKGAGKGKEPKEGPRGRTEQGDSRRGDTTLVARNRNRKAGPTSQGGALSQPPAPGGSP